MINENKKPQVAFVSLSVGDPELLTLKAVRLIKEADIVMLPAVDNGDTLRSRAKEIVEQWADDRKTRLYVLPMSKRRDAALEVYDSMCRDIAESCRMGKRVVVGVEGDISIYASIHYVLDRLTDSGVETIQVPGITSFIAAASSQNLSLVSQNERLVVVPGNADCEELSKLIANGNVVVVMKLSQCQQEVKKLLTTNGDVLCHYFENISTDKEFHTVENSVIVSRDIPYFSLAILRKANE